MEFHNHDELLGSHAFLGASNYHWINYRPEKLEQTYLNHLAVQKGTELHAFAAEAIRLRIKLSRSRQTLNLYVNDAIGFGMTPEQVLYYSPNSFGTADAISFRKNFLRIHDLKTGQTEASFNQLDIYAALFCLEYKVDPYQIDCEERIYQFDDVRINIPDPKGIRGIMDTIIDFDRRIEKIKMEG